MNKKEKILELIEKNSLVFNSLDKLFLFLSANLNCEVDEVKKIFYSLLSNGDIFEIKTISPYPSDYGDCVDQAKKEQDENARPALASNVEDMSVYDIVFVGYPNWWGTMPMAVFNFLESYDFNGKTIVPFCTHEGSAMGRSERDIKQLLPSSEVLNGKPVRGSRVKSSGEDIKSWLEGLGFCK